MPIPSNTLIDYLKKCRWFAGKARQVKNASVSREIPFGSATLWIVEVDYAEGDSERYQLPVATVNEMPDFSTEQTLITETDGKYLIDAIYTDAFRRNLFAHVYRAESVGEAAEELAFLRGKGLDTDDAPEHISTRVLAVDSSNSALVFGEKYFFKLYRKLFDLPNPEVEMIEFLTEHSDFRQMPAFCGSVTLQSTGKPDITLGMMQRMVDAQKDNWDCTGDYLNDFLYSVPNRVFSIQEDVFERVHLLGRRTGEMHRALYNPNADSTFSPEPFTGEYCGFLQKRLNHLLESRYNLLIDKYQTLDESTQALAWKFMEAKELIDEFSQELLSREIKSQRVRIHGDYHLGQVLNSDRDFIVIDFEGEPEASIADRKVKHSPLKDVAGMVRSYHYAVSAKLFESDETRYLEPGKLLKVTERWYKLVRDTYLDGYTEAIGWPHPLFKDQNEINSLMLYYLLEKAVYELGYELSYRPDWVKIPLKGIVDVIREVEKLHG